MPYVKTSLEDLKNLWFEFPTLNLYVDALNRVFGVQSEDEGTIFAITLSEAKEQAKHSQPLRDFILELIFRPK